MTQAMDQPTSQVDSDFSLQSVEGGAIFTIERPGKLNALTKPVLDGLSECIDTLEANGGRLLIITGRGERAFCAGTDLAEMQSMAMDTRLAKSEMARSLFHRLNQSRLISVAAINGFALGGGLELAMACTLRIAVASASFSLPEIKLGLLPAYAGTQLLPVLVGPGRALELMLTGRTIDLDEAIAIGLVHRASSPGIDIGVAGLAFAREITQFSAPAIEAIRECVDAAGSRLSEAGLAVEDKWVRAVFPGPEAEAGVAAFLNRSRPKS